MVSEYPYIGIKNVAESIMRDLGNRVVSWDSKELKAYDARQRLEYYEYVTQLWDIKPLSLLRSLHSKDPNLGMLLLKGINGIPESLGYLLKGIAKDEEVYVTGLKFALESGFRCSTGYYLHKVLRHKMAHQNRLQGEVKVTHYDDRNLSKQCKKKARKLAIAWNLHNDHAKAVGCRPASIHGIDLILEISPDKFSKSLLDAQYRHLTLLYAEFSEDWETNRSKHFSPFMAYLKTLGQ